MSKDDTKRALFAAALSLGTIVSLAALAVACSQVAGIDVTYADGGGTASGEGGGNGNNVGDGGIGASPDARIELPIFSDASFADPDSSSPVWPSCFPPNDDAGPCDGTQGLGCCYSPGGAATCIEIAAIATQCQNGIFIGCQQTDPTTESFCCWNHGMGTGASSLFSASCGDRPMACTDDSQCPGSKCSKVTCGGALEIGACGATPPVCPQ
jgi:hypothetical protein